MVYVTATDGKQYAIDKPRDWVSAKAIDRLYVHFLKAHFGDSPCLLRASAIVSIREV
jgi:hypothetical protein